MFTKEYFIQKFEAIPEERWITRRFVDAEGRCCAYGHCGINTVIRQTAEAKSLSDLFSRSGIPVLVVNDGRDFRYQQSTPKQRILAALRDLP